jgi:WD40 repeat protein
MLLASGSDDCTTRLWDLGAIEDFVRICSSLDRTTKEFLQRICVTIEHDGYNYIEAGSEDERIFNMLPSSIEKLLKKKVFVLPESAECSICYEDVSRRDMALLACGHMFHDKCIARWREKGCQTCPLCKQ